MKKEILIIDANKATRFLLHTTFKKHYHVLSVPDGISALYCLKQRKPELIIMDPDLPDMKDWELVKQLSLNPLYSHIPLVVVSSLDETNLRASVMKHSIAEYFSKPFNPMKLVETVDMLLMGSTIYKI